MRVSPFRLILSAPLVALISASPIPGKDACGNLGNKRVSDITYQDIEACYKAIPFDRDVASSIIGSVHLLFKDYYVFRDSALTPNLQEPFTSPPVDIMEKIENIRQKKYTSDYWFHDDIAAAITSLNDAHARYHVNCYNRYTFLQPLNLYAPVVDGKQSIYVYKDFLNRGVEDCEVLAIDDQSALPYIQHWSNSLGFSKDAGVRQNWALSHQIYDKLTGEYTVASGEFAERTSLPKKPHVDYEIKCRNSTTPIKIRDTWRIVISKTLPEFNSIDSYVSNVCKSSTGSGESPAKKKTSGQFKHLLFPVRQKSAFYDLLPNKADDTQELFGAELLAAGNATVYYQLKDQPDVGVIVVYTHNVRDETSELELSINVMKEFHKRKVSNLIIDFQTNLGGSVDFASTLVQLFFPNKSPLDKILPSNLRVDESIQEVSKAVFNMTDGDGGLYDGMVYVDFDTQQQFTNDAVFLDPITITKNGRSAKFTKHIGIATTVLPYANELHTYPWTNNPGNIRLLTDGSCGSSCALSSHYFHTLYNVSAYAIGGIQGKDLSIFSFAGGAVGSLSGLNEVYATANVTSPLSDLVYKGGVSLPLLEVYARGSEVPLEYDYSMYTANYHLNLDFENSRRRDVMWSQVAVDAWK
ncbi:hypothetical protein BGZ49_009475 [Haplosporangium sp. Z 27]|nr:hypothetical protein BGZ49_009475 [Haplosporangium sp. Z 27]